MRLHRFYIDLPIRTKEQHSLTDISLVHQLGRVFRLHEGDKAIFFNGDGIEHESEIVSLTKNECVFRVLETRPVKQFGTQKLVLAVSLIKKDNFEWVIQKGTELGVSEFIPLVSERSEKKGFNMERARKIMIEAIEQSGRGTLAIIHEPLDLETFLADEKRSVIAFHMEGEELNKGLSEKLKVIDAKQNEIVACIGPEGGWSPKELSLFKEKGASIIKLDTPVLRAETAAIAVASYFCFSK